MRILVVPERLRNLAQTLRHSESEWQALSARLNNQYRSLDWEVRQQAALDASVGQALRLSSDLAARAGELAAFLESAAARFEAADQQGVSQVSGLGRDALALLGSAFTLPAWTGLRAAGLSAWQQLSAALGAPLPGLYLVPTGGGNALTGIALLSSLPLLGSALRDLAESIWNWLHHYGWRTNAELSSAASYRFESSTGVPKGRLSQVIIQGLQKHASAPPQASDSGHVIQTLKIDQPSQVESPQTSEPSFGHAVPLISQQGLKYNDKNTQYGCTAASASMVLQYWHNKNPEKGGLSAQEILDANIKQGKFDPNSGMSVSEVYDEIQKQGYSTIETRINADFETLKKDLQQGPVIAIVKLGMQKSGYNHAVVVTGISDSGQVMVNDPWDGQRHIYTAEKFQSSWGADFGRGMKNMYTVIRP